MIKPINPIKPSPIIFSSKSILKTLFKNGELPSVVKGLYGGKLTKDNATLEHIKAKSKGGASALTNYALATFENNGKRGNAQITNYLTKDNAIEYLKQFENVQLPNFDGNQYIKGIVKTLKKEGLDILA